MHAWQISTRDMGTSAEVLFAGWQEQFQWTHEQSGPLRTMCWIVYWSPDSEIVIEQLDDEGQIIQTVPLQPQKVCVIAPDTHIRRTSGKQMRHGYAHIRWNPSGKQIRPGVQQLPMSGEGRSYWTELAHGVPSEVRIWNMVWTIFAALPDDMFVVQEYHQELRQLEEQLAARGWPAVSNEWMAQQLAVHGHDAALVSAHSS